MMAFALNSPLFKENCAFYRFFVVLDVIKNNDLPAGLLECICTMLLNYFALFVLILVFSYYFME